MSLQRVNVLKTACSWITYKIMKYTIEYVSNLCEIKVINNKKSLSHFFLFILQMENPWSIHSIYELQYFICPSCSFKDHSKQELINHAYEFHPDCVNYLEIRDNSLNDIVCPWNELSKEIKLEPSDENIHDTSLEYDNETNYENLENFGNLEDQDYSEEDFYEGLEDSNITTEVNNDPLNIDESILPKRKRKRKRYKFL